MGNSPSQADQANDGEDEEKKGRESTASSSGSGMDMLKAGAAVAGTALLALGTWQLLSQSSSSGAAETDEDEAVMTRTGRAMSNRVDGGRYLQFEGFQLPSPGNPGELYTSAPLRTPNGGSCQKVIKILSYNVCFREDNLQERMRAIGNLIQEHSPDLICFQEVTPKIHEIFENSNWGEAYRSSTSPEQASKRRSYSMQMSKLPAAFDCKRIIVSDMARDLCIAEVDVGMGRKLVFAACHLKSPNPHPQNPDQTYSDERVAQLKKAINHLNSNYSSNIVLGGDLNWDEEEDGALPLPRRWVDAWEKLRPGEEGCTFDTKANGMRSRKPPLQKRLDRFLCRLNDFSIDDIDMIGTEPIPELSSKKKKVLPSDHFGLLLTISAP